MFNYLHRIRVPNIQNITARARHHQWMADSGFEPANVAQAKIDKLNKAAALAWKARDGWQAAMCRKSPSCRALRNILKECSPDSFIGDIDISMQEIMGLNGYGLIAYIAIIRECGVDLAYPGCTYTLDMFRKQGTSIKAYYIVKQDGSYRKVTADKAARFMDEQPKYNRIPSQYHVGQASMVGIK